MIQGKRVVLREVEDSDLEVMTRWRNDPEINKYFFTHEPTTVERQRQWIASNRERKDEKLFIIASADNPKRPIGTVGLVHIDHHHRRAEWGRFLIGDASARESGFGSEALYLSLKYAFQDLNLERLYLEVYSWNETARAFYEKFGFTLEGTYRAHVYSDGQFHDVALYGLLRSEFLENESKIRELCIVSKARSEC